jgi:hypothetical protein
MTTSSDHVDKNEGVQPGDLDEREASVTIRLARIERLEAEAAAREAEYSKREVAKKQVLLRLAPSLWRQIASWADDEYRSINGQIEYLLSEAVRKR